MISVRPAEQKDADAAIDVVRRSINQLCVADHHNDEKTLATWLANKTPQNFLTWLSNTDNFCVVAESSSRLVGVGVVNRRGEILLFYLAPGAQRQGIGKMVHTALEEKAAQWGLTSLHLDSTALACRFYEAVGYRPTGSPISRFGGLQCFPYAKQLQPDKSMEGRAWAEGRGDESHGACDCCGRPTYSGEGVLFSGRSLHAEYRYRYSEGHQARFTLAVLVQDAQDETRRVAAIVTCRLEDKTLIYTVLDSGESPWLNLGEDVTILTRTQVLDEGALPNLFELVDAIAAGETRISSRVLDIHEA